MKQNVSFTTRDELRWVEAYGLPVHLLARARKRVRLVSLMGMGGFAIFLAYGLVYGISRSAVQPGFLDRNLFNLAADGVSFVIATLLYLLSGSRRVGEAVFLNVALVASVLVCAIISVVAPWYYAVNSNALPHVTWVPAIIILVPLLLPVPPRRTLAASVASALTVPAGLLTLREAGITHFAFPGFILLCISPAIAVVIAWLGSKEVYGINRKLAAAERVAGYTLEKKIGEGGMGVVWLATHRLLSRTSAIKLIRDEYLSGRDREHRRNTVARFEREARATAALQSPHTVSLYDFGVSDDGKLYYAMEFLDGMDMDSLAARAAPVPAERTVYLLLQACESLAEAHEHGLIHRDIKPSNLFLCRYARRVDFVKVLDFGIAKAIGPAAGNVELTVTAKALGSANFMAPEQAAGTGTEDARSDVYSLGCVAYWLLTGEPVFEGATPVEMMRHHVESPPVPPSRRAPSAAIPPELDALVLACLEKDPARRPQSMDDLARALAALPLERTWTQAAAAAWWETA